MKKIILLVCGMLIFLTSFSQSKYAYTRYARHNYWPRPVIVNRELSLERDKNGQFILRERANYTEIKFTFLKRMKNGKYVYRGEGRFGPFIYDFVTIESNIKLGSLLKGGGNSINNPFDEKYKISALFLDIGSIYRFEPYEVDYYIIENPPQAEIDAKEKLRWEQFKKEQEGKRIAEKERRIAEIKRAEEKRIAQECDSIEKIVKENNNSIGKKYSTFFNSHIGDFTINTYKHVRFRKKTIINAYRIVLEDMDSDNSSSLKEVIEIQKVVLYLADKKTKEVEKALKIKINKEEIISFFKHEAIGLCKLPPVKKSPKR